MMFATFPIVYQQVQGWSPGVGGLAFIGIDVGMVLAVVYALFDNKRYRTIEAKFNGKAPPESKVSPAIFESVCLRIGLFWLAWTNYSSVHWSISIIGTALFGFGVFLGVTNYLIDSYVIYAASVLAASRFLRSVFGAVFPLFTSCKNPLRLELYLSLAPHRADTMC